jgi:hypothetical protein
LSDSSREVPWGATGAVIFPAFASDWFSVEFTADSSREVPWGATGAEMFSESREYPDFTITRDKLQATVNRIIKIDAIINTEYTISHIKRSHQKIFF